MKICDFSMQISQPYERKCVGNDANVWTQINVFKDNVVIFEAN